MTADHHTVSDHPPRACPPHPAVEKQPPWSPGLFSLSDYSGGNIGEEPRQPEASEPTAARALAAGLIGGGASLLAQFLVRGVFDLGPGIGDLYPGLAGGLGFWDAVIYGLFFLIEAVAAAYVYGLLARKLPRRVWLKGLIYGGLLWAAVNLLPLLGLTAFLEDQPFPRLAHWSLTWLVFILVQTLTTAAVYHSGRSKRRRRR